MLPYRESIGEETQTYLSFTELTGAIGDSVTVLPIVVGISVLTDLSLSLMLIWFGVFQIVWGLFYRAPVSVEPMKALAALVISGTISAGEYLLAGMVLGLILLAIGATDTVARVSKFIGNPVVRGIQLAVAVVLLKTGYTLAIANMQMAGLAIGVAVFLIAFGYWNMTPFAVLVVGSVVSIYAVGVPTPALPTVEGGVFIQSATVTPSTVEAAIAQLAMTIGNAALASSVLLSDYFDRDISPDQLSSSMGVMNLVSIPFGALPMCHGSGGIAGKYAFGARTAVANLILGLIYMGLAVLAVRLVSAFPLSMLGVILGLIALQLGETSISKTDSYPLVLGIGVLGGFFNLGIAFIVGVIAYLFQNGRNRV